MVETGTDFVQIEVVDQLLIVPARTDQLLIVPARIVPEVEDRIALVQHVQVFPRLPETETVVPLLQELQWVDLVIQRVFVHELSNQ